MAFKDYLTTEGERLLAKAAAGVKVNFTKMVAGSGYMPTGSIERNISAVITPIMEMNVEASVTSNSLLLLVGYMDNSKISEGFYFREKGIYASDGTSEVLVLYANAKDKAEYIESSEVAIIEKKIRTVMAISSEEAAGITLTSDKYAAAPVVSNCSSIEEFTGSTLAESMIIGQSVIIEKKVYTLVADDYTKKDSYYAGGVSSIASDEEFGLAKLSDSTDSTDDASTGIAATPLAVKTAMDIAKKALAYYEKPTFSQAETRENIASGESTPTLFGKIMKWFADLKDAAFASIANNCTTTTAGSVLDARQGKALQDNIDTVDQRVDQLDTNLTFPDGVGFYPDVQDGKRGYNTDAARGADTFIPFRGTPIFIVSEGHSTSYTKEIDCSIGDIFIITVFTFSNGKNQSVTVSNATKQYDKVPVAGNSQMREMIVVATANSITIKISVSDGWGGITVSKM